MEQVKQGPGPSWAQMIRPQVRQFAKSAWRAARQVHGRRLDLMTTLESSLPFFDFGWGFGLGGAGSAVVGGGGDGLGGSTGGGGVDDSGRGVDFLLFRREKESDKEKLPSELSFDWERQETHGL